MTTVSEIVAAIQKLTFEEKAQVARALHGWGDDAWDERMKADAAAGRFDKIVAEIEAERQAGTLVPLNKLLDSP
jgi:hypothetical protein